MATRLKRLDLHGFKSFVTPTSFVFDDGITAIIGPNGSGKSNITDALRWVLGEQSYANLRGKRTDDLIFAGSTARAPLGMAEVTVTLDNEDGNLPIGFSEVSVTRRAYRSGENQYLINGARVRLKDILQLTASLGQSHTVIGQGLVDAVLSQRVDERRGLFEHAAGITGLRIKHATASRNLEESQANCTRLEDLLADLEPRLRSLEHSARQAREYDNVRRQLRLVQERFYARHWLQAAGRLRESLESVDALACEIDEAARVRDDRRRTLAEASGAEATLARTLETLRGDIQRFHDEHQRVSHGLALIDERQSAALRRRNDAEVALAAVLASIDDVDRELADLNRSLTDVRETASCRERQLQDLDRANAESRQHLTTIESQLREAERRQASVEREAMLKETRLTLLGGRLEQLHAERGRHLAQSSERGSRRAEREAEREEASRLLAVMSRRLDERSRQLQALTTDIEAHDRKRNDIANRRSELERRIVEAGTRFETLKRLEESGVGLFTGVKQVLDASRNGQLDGVLGTLSSLLVVPGELEAAIEAALGGHLQDLVVERWTDAERAIELLKRKQSGRATFHPLDTVRESGRPSVPPPAPSVRGLAAELIDADERVRPVVDNLLGRTVVVEDLDAAHAGLRSLPPGWTIVTLGGEIVRSAGTVTGGSRIKETGALARARELRDLPQVRSRLEEQKHELSAELQSIDEALRGKVQRKSDLERDMASARSESLALRAARENAEQRLDELDREIAAERERTGRLDHDIATIQHEMGELVQAKSDGDALREHLLEESRQLHLQLLRVREAIDDEALHAARTDLSGLHERLRGMEEQRGRLGIRTQALQAQRVTSERRLTDIDAEIRELDDARASAEAERADLSQRLAGLRERHDETRSAHQAVECASQTARREADRAEERCRELERRQDHLALDAARRRDELDLTLERASRDLEEDDVETILSNTTAAEHDDLPRLERETARLRERLRRIGVAGAGAIEQYEREAERYTFLRQQLDDVRAATDALRALMAELDRTMALEFDRTFVEVSRAFEATFTALFGGGKAQLIRCEDEDGSTGIDIVAQPPGKRLQNLSLLSGGERALTAVALLFSILKVNPSPFCLLDEVDAALDEANVVRVRDELQRLATKTQFVVVTHNRATIEGADTLYGVTMGDDGISRVLSLKLPAE